MMNLNLIIEDKRGRCREISKLVDCYIIDEEPIGKGSYGEVYKAKRIGDEIKNTIICYQDHEL